MRYRLAFDSGSPEDLNPTTDADDQRSRPRTGPIEKIADIAYDALRKHEIQPGDGDASNDSR
jgi:hypothetical protein